MTDSELNERIDRFAGWYYEFNLRGRTTPVIDRGSVVRHAERRRYLFEPLLRTYGGKLAGIRMCDLGCNSGYFALHASECGTEFVLGVDESCDNIEQAELVFEAKGIEKSRYAFRCESFLGEGFQDGKPYDVMLMLGIWHWMNHFDQGKLVEKVVGLAPKHIVIDTVIAPGPERRLSLMNAAQLGPKAPSSLGFVSIPTRLGLLEIMSHLGYQGVVLRPNFADYTGSADYVDGVRRGFFFSREPIPDIIRPLAEEVDIDRDVSDLLDVSWRRLGKTLAKKAMRRFQVRHVKIS